MLGAGLDPSDRPSELLGGPHREHFFRVELALDAEASADVRRDDMKIGLGHAEHAGEEGTNEVRELGR